MKSCLLKLIPQIIYNADFYILERAANAEMKQLRDKLPSGSVLEALQSYEAFGDEIGMHTSLPAYYLHALR